MISRDLHGKTIEAKCIGRKIFYIKSKTCVCESGKKCGIDQNLNTCKSIEHNPYNTESINYMWREDAKYKDQFCCQNQYVFKILLRC